MMASSNIGSVYLILGCMFSGKTTELIRRIRCVKVLKQPFVVVTHACDTRYRGGGGGVVSHDMLHEQALALSSLSELAGTDAYTQASHVFIEEGQFFDDLYSFVVTACEKDGKHVVVSALDGDFRRQPFQQVLQLIPFAEHVKKLHALCADCKDGTLASFSKRILQNKDDGAQILVGGSESYKSVCRLHYLAQEV